MAHLIRYFAVTLAVVLLSLSWKSAMCQTNVEKSKPQVSLKSTSLEGVEGFWVIVDSLPVDIERVGLSKSRLRILAELSLRRNGIPILDSAVTSDRYAILKIDVSTGCSEADTPGGEWCAWIAEVEVSQLLYSKSRLLRRLSGSWSSVDGRQTLCDSMLSMKGADWGVVGTIWEQHGVGATLSLREAKADIEGSLSEFLDQLANEWLRANE